MVEYLPSASFTTTSYVYHDLVSYHDSLRREQCTAWRASLPAALHRHVIDREVGSVAHRLVHTDSGFLANAHDVMGSVSPSPSLEWVKAMVDPLTSASPSQQWSIRNHLLRTQCAYGFSAVLVESSSIDRLQPWSSISHRLRLQPHRTFTTTS